MPSLFIKVINSTTVQATWEPSIKLGQHKGFKLYYRKVHLSQYTGPVLLASNVTAYNITHLGEYLDPCPLPAPVVISRRELECAAQPLNAAALPQVLWVLSQQQVLVCSILCVFGKMFFSQISVTGGDETHGYT